MKKYIIIAISLLIVFLQSCTDPAVTGVSLDKTSISMPVNGTASVSAILEPSDIFGRVQWSSTNAAVATVVDGTITAISEGSAQIVATVGDFTASCNVTVTPEITAITLDKTKLRLKIDSTQTVSATLTPLLPAEATNNLIWISTNPEVATVDNTGKITAVSLGTANIVASVGTLTAICSVSVYDYIPPSLAGTNYNLIYLDAPTVDIIGTNNIVTDFRSDGVNNNFYVWNGLNAGTLTGTNFYGNTDWLSFVVTGAGGWSGAAINVKPNAQLDKLKAITDDTSGKYYLHFAIKSSTTNSYAFKLGYGASAATVVLGTASMESTLPFGNFTRNGQWQEVEIPMNYFKAKGLRYTTGMATTDIFVMLAGGTAGVKLEIDAVFIYKKP